MKSKYHHGDLANTLERAAVSLIEEKGVALLSLREVARVAQVSHGAPAHHFGDKTGLLTAIAISGYRLLAQALAQEEGRAGLTPTIRLVDAGAAYIRFALSHAAYFAVMFRPDLVNNQSPDFISTSRAAKAVLEQCVRDLLSEQSSVGGVSARKIEATVVALWSQVHGFATLWLAGNLGDPEDEAKLDDILSGMFSSLTATISANPAPAISGR